MRSKKLEAMVTYSVNQTTFDKSVAITDIIEKIKSDEFKDLILDIRKEDDKAKRSKLKKNLHAFTLALSEGLIRRKSKFISSNFFLLDFDDFESPDEVNLKLEEIIKDPEVVLAFKSPSGGLKVAYRLSEAITDSETFSNYYKEVMKIKKDSYGLEPDTTSDSLRLCYFSWDPDLYHNPNCKLLDISKFSLPEVSAKLKRERLGTSRGGVLPDEPAKRQRGKPAERKISKGKEKTKGGERLPSLIERVINFLVAYKITYAEWIKIGFYLCSLVNGEELFIKLTVNNEHYDDSENDASEKFDSLMDNYDPISYPPSIHGVLIIAKKYGFSNPYFYSIDDDSGACYIDQGKFYKEFLPVLGINYYNKQLVKITGNIIKQISIKDLKNIVLEEVKLLNISAGDKDKIESKIISSDSFLYAAGKKDYIKEVELELDIIKDTKDTANLFFQNCWVELTKDSINIRPLAECQSLILETQIIKRDFTECEFDPNFSFYQFMVNITSTKNNEDWVENNENLATLVSSLGYLLHNYKDPTNAKAVVFIDEQDKDSLGSQSQGGTGKSLMGVALGHMLYHTSISGKSLKNSDRFVFQDVTLGMKMVILNDLSKGYDFENLYVLITENFKTERKNKDKITIPFEDSPKLLISTNRVISRDDASSVRRKYQVEFSHYYDALYQPGQDFNETFFTDWNSDSWNKYFSLMIHCIQEYLKNGLVTTNQSSYYTYMLSNTSKSFIDFCDTLELDKVYNKADEFSRFKNNFPVNSNMSSIMFKQYLDFFAVAKGWRAHHRASNGKSLVEFSERNNRTSRRCPATSPITPTREILIDQALEN